MVTQISEWGNHHGIRLDKKALQVLGLYVGDTIEIVKKGEDIVIVPTHNIEWYLQGYERPDNDWESALPQGCEVCNQRRIKPVAKKTIDWYLEGYDNESYRYDWGALDEPKGREIL